MARHAQSYIFAFFVNILLQYTLYVNKCKVKLMDSDAIKTTSLSTVYSKEWASVIKRLLKTVMVKQDLSYKDLSYRLRQIGTDQSPDNLRNKINKGVLGAQLLLQIIYVCDERIDNREIEELLTLIQTTPDK